jgi:hypothetical protein
MRHLLAERKASVPVIVPASSVYVRGPAFQAYAILRVAVAALSILAGAGKFVHAHADWGASLAPGLAALLGARVGGFMHLVGALEIAAGVLVAARPRWGSPFVGLWLLVVAASFLLKGGYSDLVMRDAVLAAGVLALARLSAQFDR